MTGVTIVGGTTSRKTEKVNNETKPTNDNNEVKPTGEGTVSDTSNTIGGDEKLSTNQESGNTKPDYAEDIKNIDYSQLAPEALAMMPSLLNALNEQTKASNDQPSFEKAKQGLEDLKLDSGYDD